MTTTLPSLPWTTFDRWQTNGFVGLSKATGLFRFLRKGETMFLGVGATPSSGITARIGAYRRGAGRKHFAGEHIHDDLDGLELQICILDKPASEIRLIHDALLTRRRPPWNVPHAYRRAR